MKRKNRLLAALIAVLLTGPVAAQTLDWEVQASGFFDNREGEDNHRMPGTHNGLHLRPLLTLSEQEQGHHHITAGYNALIEWGADNELGADGLIAYYEYTSEHLNILLGKYPRGKMREVMPDYLLCDSIKYYRPCQTGFDIQYVAPHGYAEFYLDWTAKRSETVREQFMMGSNVHFMCRNLQLGINGYYYHYATERYGAEIGHRPHDNALIHPYIGLQWQQLGVLDSLDIRTGVLVGLDRNRATDNRFHTPVGFLGEVTAAKKRFSVQETFYVGGRHQYYGQEGFGEYYWGDTFYRSPWYSRTDVYFDIIKDRYVSLKTGAVFHLTEHGLQFGQLLTLSARIGN